jgi:two-component system phosphate regulon sensor histidine kinase PhoR
MGLRVRIFVVSLFLILVTFIGADAYVTRTADATLTGRIRSDLLVRLELVQREVTAAQPVPDDAFADRLGQQTSTRVTIIRADGVVTGDSEVAADKVAQLANHLDRPEVKEALAGRRATSVRQSETLHQRMIYGAAPVLSDGKVTHVVRMATPTRDVEEIIDRFHRIFLLSGVVALLTAALVSGLSVRWVTRLLRSLTDAARRMASGDLDVRTRVTGHEDVTELSTALDQLASSLSRAIEELRGERDVLTGIFDGMNEGVLLLDEEDRVRRVNRALRAMLLLQHDVIGRPLLEVVRHAELKQLIDRVRTEGQSTAEIEMSGIKPRRLLVNAAPLLGDEQSILVVIADVTDARRLETMRRDFVANVSHELRTPVTAVRSAAETLEEAVTRDPEAAKRFVDIISRNADRLQRLIEDLLDLSRIESKEYKLTRENVELSAFVSHVVSLFRERADSRKVKLHIDVPQGIVAYADRRALEQVLANLVDNAVKYCPAAEVRISAVLDGERARIQMKDTGPGIEHKHLPRVFERFYRVDAGRSRDLGGTGLGLSIVKNLVEAMGGTITVESTLGKGTSFHVSLPAVSN